MRQICENPFTGILRTEKHRGEVDEDSVSINNGEFQSNEVVGTFGKPF